MQSRDPICFFMVCFTSIPNIRCPNSDGADCLVRSLGISKPSPGRARTKPLILRPIVGAGGCHGGPDLPLHFVAQIATIQAHKN